MGRLISIARLHVLAFAERAQHLFVIFRQPRGNPDIDPDELVAPSPAVEMRNTLVPHPENSSRLCPPIDLQPRAPRNRGDIEFRSEGRIGKRQEHVDEDIVPVPGEILVWFLFYDHDEVSRRTAALP